jgi:YD repeat-containing protein
VTIYQYDGARNLRAIVSTGPDGTPVAGYRYTFDANGNRTSVSALEPNTAASSAASLAYTFDAANRPVSRSDGTTYGYDGRGALMAIQGPGNFTFAYDAFGRLASRTGDANASASYDSLGLRSTRNDRRLVYGLSGEQPRVVMELDNGNSPVAWYVYGLGLLWKVTADGTTYFYHFDGDGNTVALSTPAKGVVNTYRYDLRGNLIAASEGVENMFRVRGEQGWIDDGSGLEFTGSQYVLPELHLSLPSAIDLSPPLVDVGLQLTGLGSCFLEGVASCQSLGRAR